ncbi:NADH oxidase [Spiroplasma chinense]|uniref:NADH oxidase n=1 Tax=Spiroplasma chinense TaxID=216932 RepID=A0A5B9Y4N7_9MOLU|nr:CoA-disulfide reductase [Spiroplasma chinense]QEH61649.1 NADH oxidase [Spiroplasma chinense]
MKTIIIGGSATGMGVAARLKRNDPENEIIVYQNKSYVSLGACGLPYFVADNFQDETKLLARSIEDFEKSGVKIVSNTFVSSVDFDNKKIYFEGGEDSYDELVIATGAKPIKPAIEGIDFENIFTLTSLEDGVNLKKYASRTDVKKIAIIGAGFIGLETAEALKDLNKEVCIIEMKDHVSSKVFDEQISNLIEDNLSRNKIELLLNKQVVKFEGNEGKAKSVFLSDGTSIEVDAVVLAVGFMPNTTMFKETNLNLAKNGAIIVDKKGKTNIESVYSGGDCATSKDYITGEDIYSPLATVASKFARVIADNIAGKEAEFAGSVKSAIVRVFDNEAARTGLTESEAVEAGLSIKTAYIVDKDQTGYVPGQSDLHLKLIMDVKSNQLIGAQMFGANKSTLRINAIAALIWAKMPVDSIMEQIDLVYAPPFARTTDILHIALSKLLK